MSSWSYGHRPDSDPVVPLSSIELLRSTGSASSLRPKKNQTEAVSSKQILGFIEACFTVLSPWEFDNAQRVTN